MIGEPEWREINDALRNHCPATTIWLKKILTSILSSIKTHPTEYYRAVKVYMVVFPLKGMVLKLNENRCFPAVIK